MTDFANLGIVIDSSQVKQGVSELDKLTAAGGRAEKAVGGVTGASRSAGVAAAEMAASAQASARAAVGQVAGYTAVTSAVHGNTIAMRESLVIGRELLSGNLTRLPGSLSILAQQFAISGKSASGFAETILQSFGIIKRTTDAAVAAEAAAATVAADAVRAVAQRAEANIVAADTELALAQAAVRVAATSEAEAAAQAQVAAAHEAVTAAAAEATIAENALTVAMGREAAAAEAAAAATTVALGPMAGILIGVGIAATGVALSFQAMKEKVGDSGELKEYARSLHLTGEQFDELRKKTDDFALTFADVWNGLKKTVSDAIDQSAAWQKFKNDAANAFASALSSAETFSAYMYAFWTTNFGPGFWDRVGKNAVEAQKQIAKNVETIRANIISAAEERIKDAAGKPPKARKPSDHGLADALAELDAQIKGQLALAAAYQVSDAAAIKAQAQQKAEEQAIRHKGEVGIFYEKELALAVATRAADGGKLVNQLSGQTAAQKAVNDAVEDGTITAAQASKQMQNEAQLRPLIAAQAVAEGKAKELLAGIIARLRVEQARSNDEVNRGQVLAATEDANKQIDKLKLEASLIGATNVERAKALALLEAEQFLKDHPSSTAEGSPDYAEAQRHTQDYIKSQLQAAEMAANLTTAQDLYNRSLSYTADLLALMNERAQTIATTLSSAFGNVGSGLGQALTALSAYAAQQAKLDEEHKAAVKAGLSDEKEVDRYRKASTNNQLAATGQLIGGLKTMFKEHSVGYKAMEAAERAFAIIQAINTIKSVAAGAAKMFSQLGVWAFPAVAAMVAVMAGLGFAGAKAGGTATPPTSADDVQKAQGAGTILGDLGAKSDSIAHSLDLTAANTNKMLEYDNQQLRSLRSIDQSIGMLAAQVAKELNVGGAFDLTGKTGSTSKSGFLGLFGSTTTKSLFDQGLQFNPTSLADAIANGISGSTYQIIEKVKKSSGFLGLGGGTKTSYSTTTGALDPDLQNQVGLILGQLRDSVVSAAKVLGFDVAAALNQFQVEIGKISFKDMSADEIEKALENVFSKVADQMAGFAVSGLEQFQKAGEGLFETLQRLAKDYTTIDVALRSIGKTFGAVGSASIAAREHLIALFGSLEDFVDQTAFYQQNFLTAAQQIAPVQAQVRSTLASLGLSYVDTIAEFNHVVQGIDLTTDAGQQLYASLMALAPAFYQVEQYEQQQADAAAAIAKQRVQLQIKLLEAQGNAEAALAMQRQQELAALDPSLRALQQQVYQAQDIASAKDRLSQAYQRERSELEQTISKFGDLSKSLRAYRDTLFGGAAGGLTYNQALANLIKTGSLAAAGDATALGDLQGAGKSFLDIAKDRASTAQQYQRDVALVARYVDQGITAADGQASLAQKQLDAMTAQVGQLVNINTSVLSVKDAVLALNALMGGSGTVAPTPAPAQTPHQRRTFTRGDIDDGAIRTLLERIDGRLQDVADATLSTAGSTAKSARLHTTWDGGGALTIRTDADTPIATTVAS